MLKIVTPNQLRMGRSTARTMDGPMRLLQNMEDHQPKWFDTDKHLLPGDLVYFNKVECKLSNKWTI